MIPHRPSYWIAVAIAASLALLAFEVAGQSPGAQAVFEGRPAMAGAQAGLGAMAGPPQGGIGLQGADGAQVNLRRPDTATMGAGRAPSSQCEGPTVSAAQNPACLPQVGDERLEGRMTRLGVGETQQR